jgi:hypothetical protein
VRDHDAGDTALARRAQQPHDRLAVDRVERAGRLVGEDQAAVADDRPCDRDPLPLAPGQLVRVAARLAGKPELLQDGEAGLARRLLAGPVELQRQGDVFHGGQPGEQVEVLEHVADRAAAKPRPPVGGHAAQRGSADEHLAAARLLETAGDGQQRALAGPARAHHGDQLAGADGHLDVSQRVHLAGAGTVDFGHPA